MPEITLKSSWEELNTPERWRRWLDISAVEDPDGADYWGTVEACAGCIHLDQANIWCRLRELPASWTPDLDKLWRCVGDALTGVVWVDDSQVCLMTPPPSKQYGDKPGVHIVIKGL